MGSPLLLLLASAAVAAANVNEQTKQVHFMALIKIFAEGKGLESSRCNDEIKDSGITVLNSGNNDKYFAKAVQYMCIKKCSAAADPCSVGSGDEIQTAFVCDGNPDQAVFRCICKPKDDSCNIDVPWRELWLQYPTQCAPKETRNEGDTEVINEVEFVASANGTLQNACEVDSSKCTLVSGDGDGGDDGGDDSGNLATTTNEPPAVVSSEEGPPEVPDKPPTNTTNIGEVYDPEVLH